MEGLMLHAMLPVLAMLGLFAWTKPSTAEVANIVACTLRQIRAEFIGSCDVPCLVNALAIDIGGSQPGTFCDAPPRRVPATLKEVAPGKYLGTMKSKFPEDPKRFELLLGKPGVAKTPFGWFPLHRASVSGDAMQLTIAAGAQLPPTMDDIRIIRRVSGLVSEPGTQRRRKRRWSPWWTTFSLPERPACVKARRWKLRPRPWSPWKSGALRPKSALRV